MGILTEEQLITFKENYANMIIDRADLDSLMQMCYDMLMDSYHNVREDEIVDEILDLYDEETLSDLMPVKSASQYQRDLYNEVIEYQRQGGDL
jgi:hypothetical protein